MDSGTTACVGKTNFRGRHDRFNGRSPSGYSSHPAFPVEESIFRGSLVAVGANEPVVPASDMVEALKRIKQLEGALGRKTLENEILKEAVEYGKARKWIARSPLLPGDEQ